MGGLVALTRLVLWIWEQSPYGRYLNHGQWDQAGLASAICAALPFGTITVPALFYVGGWVLMIVAMMLPTTLPLLEIFRRIARARADRNLLVALLIAGYLVVWIAFGALAHMLDWLVHVLATNVAWLTFNAWLFGTVALLVAGAFQFSDLKYRCLDKCRTPLSFVTSHWRGRNQRWQSFKLGLYHGAFCVGWCWAIMLLMFVVGTGSLGWMMALGLIMAAEKNLPWGHRLSTPLGLALIAWGLVVVAANTGVVDLVLAGQG